MRARTIIVGIVGLGVVIVGLGGAWYLLRRKPAALCPFSGREIHAQTRAWVTIGGQKYETCCVRCAIIEAQQTGKPLQVLEVADFKTGKLLSAEKGWYVEGSTVNLCMSMAPGAESRDRQAVYVRGFDRCAPSVNAFATEDEARAFMTQHGGVLKRLDELEHEVERGSAGVKGQ